MPKNLVDAIMTIIDSREYEVANSTDGGVSLSGKGFEDYVKKAFADALVCSHGRAARLINTTFLYTGSKNSPPDAIIRDGEVLEIKKLETLAGEIQFNSSRPKAWLSREDKAITQKCRERLPDPWRERIIFVVGILQKNTGKLNKIFFVYGEDYCPEISCKEEFNSLKGYLGKNHKILTEGIQELGRINNIGDHNTAALRIRGMWIMKSPWEALRIPINRSDNGFEIYAVVNNNIWEGLANRRNLEEKATRDNRLTITDFEFPNPNSLGTLQGKLIKFIR